MLVEVRENMTFGLSWIGWDRVGLGWVVWYGSVMLWCYVILWCCGVGLGWVGERVRVRGTFVLDWVWGWIRLEVELGCTVV